MSELSSIHNGSAPEAKISLFRSLFRGRDDVYARRYENRLTGQAGYQPACGNEWIRGICEKPRIKCSVCAHQRFLSVTDEVIRWHLTGVDSLGRDFVTGIYPLLRDETCFLIAIDLNNPGWQLDAIAIQAACRKVAIQPTIERSRSGVAGHVWFFFEQAIPAKLARKLVATILTEAMESRPELGFECYDRCYPNQDTLPHQSFGSVIALPLQKVPREFDNTIFLDTELLPIPDQWEFLSQVQKLSRPLVENIVESAHEHGRVYGMLRSVANETELPATDLHRSRPRFPQERNVINEKFPNRVEVRLHGQIEIAAAGLPPQLRNRLIRLAAFPNPEFQAAQSMKLPVYGKPQFINCADVQDDFIGLPRGCLDDLQSLLSSLKINWKLKDERESGAPLEVQFHGQLRPEQTNAVNAILQHETGVLSATTAFGKTVVAAWLIAQRAVNVLILVHRRQLLEQWVERLATFLNISPKSIGRIGGGRKKTTGKIDVAVIQSLIRDGHVNDLVEDYGHVIIDECHHLSARSFERVVRRVRAKFLIGLSATVTRKDGHQPIIFMQCGPIRYRVDALAQAALRPFVHTVHVRPTEFRAAEGSTDNLRIQFRDLYSQLISDAARNQLICDEVTLAVRAGRSPLVLTERNEHLDRLAKRLISRIPHVVVLRGGLGRKATRQAIAQLAAVPLNEHRVILAIGGYIGEGFDDPQLDTLFLTLPVSWHGTIAQYVGRLHRLHDLKREVLVYDYADLNVPMLSRMFDRRCRGYEAVGYQIQLPASAVPGWPSHVPLPVDPQWKDAFAATVRRLCRDGIDAVLAGLFVEVAQPDTADPVGADRARCATEAFLFRRLETLEATQGRFILNAILPIPFDDQGQMEVDLLCSDARLAIELDGAQHLESFEAYRSDRRKDQLLQENGYFVVRFLSRDVSAHLDRVLDTILRTLEHRVRAQQKVLGKDVERC